MKRLGFIQSRLQALSLPRALLMVALLSGFLPAQKVFSPFGTEFLRQSSSLLYDWTLETVDTNRTFRMNLGGDAYPGGFFDGYVYFSEALPQFRIDLSVLDLPLSWSPLLLHRPTRPKYFPDSLRPTSWYGVLAEAKGEKLGASFYYAGQGQGTISGGSNVAQAVNAMLGMKTALAWGPVNAEFLYTSHFHRDLGLFESNQDLLSPDLAGAVYENFWFSNAGVHPGFWLERIALSGEAGSEVVDGNSSAFPDGLVFSATPQNVSFEGRPYLWFPGDVRLSFSNRQAGKRWTSVTLTYAGNVAILRNRSEGVELNAWKYRPIPWSIARAPDAALWQTSAAFSNFGPHAFRRTVTFHLDHQANQGFGVNLSWQGRSVQARLAWAVNEKNQGNKTTLRQGGDLLVKARLPGVLATLSAHAHEDGFSTDLDGDPAVEIKSASVKPYGVRFPDPQDQLMTASGLSPGFFWYYENPAYYFRALGQDLNHNGIEDDRELFITPDHFPVAGDYAEGRLSFSGSLGRDWGWTALADGRLQDGQPMTSLAFIAQWRRTVNNFFSAGFAAMEEFLPNPNRLPSPSLDQADFLTPAVLKNQLLAVGDGDFSWNGLKVHGEANLSLRAFEAGAVRFETTPALSVERSFRLSPALEIIPRARYLVHLQRGSADLGASTNATNAFDFDRAVLGSWSESFLLFLCEARVKYGAFQWHTGGELSFYDQDSLGMSNASSVYTLSSPLTRMALTSRLEYKGAYLGRPMGLSLQIQGGLFSEARPSALPALDQWKRFSSILIRLYTGF